MMARRRMCMRPPGTRRIDCCSSSHKHDRMCGVLRMLLSLYFCSAAVCRVIRKQLKGCTGMHFPVSAKAKRTRIGGGSRQKSAAHAVILRPKRMSNQENAMAMQSASLQYILILCSFKAWSLSQAILATPVTNFQGVAESTSTPEKAHRAQLRRPGGASFVVPMQSCHSHCGSPRPAQPHSFAGSRPRC